MHRTTFTRQAANLWAVKKELQKHLLGRIGSDLQISPIDGFPVEVCRFAQAYRCRCSGEDSAFGYDEAKKADLLRLTRPPESVLAGGDSQQRRPRPGQRP